MPEAPERRKPMEVDKKAQLVSLRPRNFDELWNFCKMISETDFVPLALRGKPGAVIAACQYGGEVGLPPMTALRWIAVVNGTPTLWGDGVLMLVNTHPMLDWIKETPSDSTEAEKAGSCTIKRKDRADPITRRFTVEMAQKAKLWGGTGDTPEKKARSVWAKYPGRMLQMRARALCVRDAIPEALGPMTMREEAEDYIETTGSAIVDEPLKIPAQIGESTAVGEAHDETARETSPVPDPGTGSKEVENKGPFPLVDISDRGDSASASTTTDAPPDTTPPPAEKAKPAKKTKEEAASKWSKESLLNWLAEEASTDEIMARENTLTKGLKDLDQNGQIETVRAWNARRKAILADRETQ